MVGDGPLAPSLHDVARRFGIAERILWLGERDARTVMAGFDVFAIPSCKEGLPYVVLEAMSAGLPVVATDSAGVEILVAPGVNGEVVPRGDVVAFGRALASLVLDRPRMRRYGQASLERVRRFTVDAMVEGTLAAYEGRLRPGEDAPALPSPPPAAGPVMVDEDLAEQVVPS
jgi:glycosyltransferase involved in cell wall biosynthesis